MLLSLFQKVQDVGTAGMLNEPSGTNGKFGCFQAPHQRYFLKLFLGPVPQNIKWSMMHQVGIFQGVLERGRIRLNGGMRHVGMACIVRELKDQLGHFVVICHRIVPR